MAHIVGPLPRVTMDVSDQLRRALRAMPLRPRVLELARWGVWSELLAMGEEATREETDDSREEVIMLLNMSPMTCSWNLDKVGVRKQLFDLSHIGIVTPSWLLAS